MRNFLRLVPAVAIAACDGGGGSPDGRGDPVEPAVAVIDQWGDGVGEILVATHDSNGALVRSAWTDENGVADLPPLEGGAITVYHASYHSPSRLMIESIHRPGAGPIRFLVMTPPPGNLPAPTTYTVDVTGAPPETQYVYLANRCGSAASFDGFPLEMSDMGCPQYEDEAFFAMARNATNGDLAWGMMTGVAKDPGGTLPLTIPLSSTAFRTVTVGGYIPPGTLPIDGVWASVRGHMTDGPGEWASTWPTLEVASNGEHTWSTQIADAPVAFWSAAAIASYPLGERAVYALTTSAMDLAFSMDSLPLVPVEPLDISDPAQPVIRWTATASSAANVVVASSTWLLDSGDSVTLTGLLEPALAGGEYRMLELPQEVEEWGQGAVDVVYGTSVEYRRSTLLGTQADVAADTGRGYGGMELFTGGIEFAISRAPM